LQSPLGCFSAPPAFIEPYHFYLNVSVPVESDGEKITITFPSDYSIESILLKDGTTVGPNANNSPCPPQPHVLNTFQCKPKSFVEDTYFKVKFKLHTPKNANENPSITLVRGSEKCSRNDNYCKKVQVDSEEDDGKISIWLLGTYPKEVVIVAGILVGLMSIGFVYLLVRRQMFLCGYGGNKERSVAQSPPPCASPPDDSASRERTTMSKAKCEMRKKGSQARLVDTTPNHTPRNRSIDERYSPASQVIQMEHIAPVDVSAPMDPNKLHNTLSFVMEQNRDQSVHYAEEKDRLPVEDNVPLSKSVSMRRANRQPSGASLSKPSISQLRSNDAIKHASLSSDTTPLSQYVAPEDVPLSVIVRQRSQRQQQHPAGPSTRRQLPERDAFSTMSGTTIGGGDAKKNTTLGTLDDELPLCIIQETRNRNSLMVKEDILDSYRRPHKPR
jgi:hypothetical protein